MRRTHTQNVLALVRRRQRSAAGRRLLWLAESLEVRRLLTSISGFANFTLNGADGTGINGSSTANNNHGAAPVISGSNSELTVTTAATYQASSAWYDTPVNIQNFTVSFAYSEGLGTNPPADGITFTLQNDPRGVHAIAGGGGDLGYTSNSFVATPIANSFAVEFNIYGTSQTSYATDGGGKIDAQTTGSLNLAAGDPIVVSLSYNSTTQTLVETLTDNFAYTSFSTSYTNINLSAVLGSNLAYIGFTGGTGGGDANQVVYDFVYAAQGFTGFSLNAANGAGIDGSAFQDNNHGSAPTISADRNVLTITTAAANQASSAFSSTSESFQDFTAGFTYQESGSSNPSSGFAFVLEDDSRASNALGGGGADLGYGTDSTQPAVAISPSFAVEFNINNVSSTAIGIDGSTSSLPTASSNTGNVNLRSGDPINVSLNYNSSVLTETLTDTVTNATFTTSYSGLNLPVVFNSNTAYFGVTGGTGAAGALQTISNFSFAPYSSVPPPAPPGPVSGFANFTLNAANGQGLNGSSTSNDNPSGSPSVNANQNTLTLTTAGYFEASSAIYDFPVTYQNFTASFTYTASAAGGLGAADGFTFLLENDPRDINAIGAGGGQLGWGNNSSDNNDNATPISSSFAAEFNVYQVSSVAVTTSGTPFFYDMTNVPYGERNTGSVNLASGDPINISLSYNSIADTLQEALSDATTKASCTVMYTDVSLPADLGAPTARIGFTGGTGGGYSQQAISNFTFTTSANVPPPPTLPPAVNSLNGFANFNLPSTPAMSADLNTLTLTTESAGEETMAFSGAPVTYGNLTATFTYTATDAFDSGFAFTLEDIPATNLGGFETGGYSLATPNSFAVVFDVVQNGGISVAADGTLNYPEVSNTGSVNLASGDPIAVLLSSNGQTQVLSVTLADTVTHATNITTFANLNLWRFLNGSPGTYVGFTGENSTTSTTQQTISSFTYSASASEPIADATGPQASLGGYFNAYAIEDAGSPSIDFGFDSAGDSLLESYFGSSQTIDVNGTNQTFNFGAAGAPDAIQTQGQTINLPQGKYGYITLIGAAANGNKLNLPFGITYTDGTTQIFTQSFSDWWYPGNTFPDESIAIPMTYWVTDTGTATQPGVPMAVYDYSIPINPTRTVESITLPNNAYVKILAMNLNAAPAVTGISPTSGPAAGGTSVTINGSGFTGATAVDFGTSPASSFTINNDASITAVDPAGSGTVDVTVVGPYGSSEDTSADKFSYLSQSITVTNVVVNGDNPNGLYTAPGAANGKQRSMVEDIVYTFSAPVSIANANQAFTMALAGSVGTLPSTLSAVSVPGSNGTQWAVILTGKAEGTLASIANGEYSITVNPQYVVSAADGTTPISSGRTDTFYRLFGDINGDEVVNAADNFQLKTALSTYNPAFDSNGDGVVNAADNFQFKASQSISFVGFTPTI